MNKRLEEIENRIKNATPGPWRAYDWPSFPRRDEYESCVRIENKTTIAAFCFNGKPNHDALLIAHSPQDLADLSAALRVCLEGLRYFDEVHRLNFTMDFEELEKKAHETIAEANKILEAK